MTDTVGNGSLRTERRYQPRLRKARRDDGGLRAFGLFIFRYGLPFAALCVIAVVALWPQFTKPVDVPAPPQAAIQDRAQVTAPQFYSQDEQGQPYSVIAESAEPLDEMGESVLLNRPEMEITLDNGDWIAVLADEARYEAEDGAVQLWGRVNILRDDGLQVITEEAHFDMGQGVGWGDSPVVVSGDFGTIEAQGFRLDNENRDLMFVGATRLQIRGDGP